MSVYSGFVRAITPATNDDNWFLAANASEACKVVSITCSGTATASDSLTTRWARSSSQSGTTTAGSVAKKSLNSATNLVSFGTTFATTQPTLDAGDLFVLSWNVHGGVFYWHAGAPDEEWELIGAATETLISCRGDDTPVSTYGVDWRES